MAPPDVLAYCWSMTWLMKRLLPPLLALLVLAACAPALQNGRAALVLINGPMEERVPGLAEDFQTLLERDPAAPLYRFAAPAAVRFQEVRRDMHGRRAPLQAAFIARNLGAEYAVMVGAPRYERRAKTILTPLGEQRLVTTAVRLEVTIIDPETAAVMFRQRSGLRLATRLEPAHKPLVEEARDPDLLDMRRGLLRDLAPPTVAELSFLLAP
jgi:hypothetical protein